VSALTAALATAGLLTLGSAHAVPIADTTHEPTNNTLAGATPGNVGDTFTGCVGAFCLVAATDPADFVSFGSLVFGNTYALSLKENGDLNGNSLVDFDLYKNGAATSSQTVTLSVNGTAQLSGLTGLTSLILGIHLSANNPSGANGCCEGYSAQLTQTGTASTGVPEPASAALIAAGLVGAFVARRRRRT
jgi:hypothetical protein